jgi:hypothetical protein
MPHCALCNPYIYDTLHSHDGVLSPRTSKELTKARPEIATTVPRVWEIINELDQSLVAHLGTVDTTETFRICLQVPIVFEICEEILEHLSRRAGARTKVLRGWLVNRILLILQTIHAIHVEHITLPIKHLEAKASPPPFVGEIKEIPSIGGRVQIELTIRVPDYDESDLYC